MTNSKAGYTFIRTLLRKNLVNSNHGYTLIEILVAISITGMIFGAGFISFRDFSRRQVLVSAERALRGDLRLVQEYALIGKKPPNTNCDDPNMLAGYSFLRSLSSRYLIRAY